MIDISLGNWNFLRIAQDEAGVEQVYIVHTNPGGINEVSKILLGPNTAKTFNTLISNAERLRIHANE